MRHVPRALTVLSLALAAWCVFALVGRSSANTAMFATIATLKEENSAIVEGAYREKRALAVKYARDMANARTAERQLAGRLDARLVSTAYTLDSARTVLADSLASGNTLRYTLAFTVAKLDTLAVQTQAYRTATDSLTLQYQRERLALHGALQSADAVIVAKNLAIGGWRKAAQCTIIFGIRCPTRTQTFVLGAIATGAVVIALR